MNKLQYKKIFLSFFVSVGLLFTGGCGFVNHKPSSSDGTVTIPDTSTLRDRQEFLNETLADPRELKPGEIAITIRIRPQFVLHLNKKLKVVSFEALNADAVSLKKETRKKWKRKPYEKAVRRILEQAVVDGYISDVSPVIDVQVVESAVAVGEDSTTSIGDDNSSAKSDASSPSDDLPNAVASTDTMITFVDVRTIEENVQSVAEEVAEIHGISAEIVLHEAGE